MTARLKWPDLMFAGSTRADYTNSSNVSITFRRIWKDRPSPNDALSH